MPLLKKFLEPNSATSCKRQEIHKLTVVANYLQKKQAHVPTTPETAAGVELRKNSIMTVSNIRPPVFHEGAWSEMLVQILVWFSILCHTLSSAIKIFGFMFRALCSGLECKVRGLGRVVVQDRKSTSIFSLLNRLLVYLRKLRFILGTMRPGSRIPETEETNITSLLHDFLLNPVLKHLRHHHTPLKFLSSVSESTNWLEKLVILLTLLMSFLIWSNWRLSRRLAVMETKFSQSNSFQSSGWGCDYFFAL